MDYIKELEQTIEERIESIKDFQMYRDEIKEEAGPSTWNSLWMGNRNNQRGCNDKWINWFTSVYERKLSIRRTNNNDTNINDK